MPPVSRAQLLLRVSELEGVRAKARAYVARLRTVVKVGRERGAAMSVVLCVLCVLCVLYVLLFCVLLLYAMLGHTRRGGPQCML